jgi:hypothetical protein
MDKKRTWTELTDQEQTDLLEWYNVSTPDYEDKRRLAKLLNAGLFAAWNCPQCGTRCYFGDPDNWGHFQGVLQVDYCSYPGNKGLHTHEYNLSLCNSCRMMCFPKYEMDPTGVLPFNDNDF